MLCYYHFMALCLRCLWLKEKKLKWIRPRGRRRTGRKPWLDHYEETRQDAGRRSKRKDGRWCVLCWPGVELVQRRASKEIGQHNQQAKHVSLSSNLLRLDQIKEPAPEVVVPTFRTPPGLIFGLHDGMECSVGLEATAIAGDAMRSGAEQVVQLALFWILQAVFNANNVNYCHILPADRS